MKHVLRMNKSYSNLEVKVIIIKMSSANWLWWTPVKDQLLDLLISSWFDSERGVELNFQNTGYTMEHNEGVYQQVEKKKHHSDTTKNRT